MDVEDVEALLVDDAAPNQATAMAGKLVSCSLAALTTPCIIAITRQNSYLNELFILDLTLSAPGFGIDKLIRRPLFTLDLPNLLAEVR